MRWPILVLVAIVACGDNGPPSPDAAQGFAEATHAKAPQVLSGGGPVLTSPTIVPVFFTGDDDMQHQLEAFLYALAPSDYWRTATSEYGVGTPTVLPSVVSSDPPPTTDDELEAFIEAHVLPPPSLARGIGIPDRWPPPDANTVYVVFLPEGVTLSAGSDVSCKTFGGYHSETDRGDLVYALLPRCKPNGAPIDEITPATSHELIEASTDPHPGSAPAFVEIDDPDLVWQFTPGGELGDMCEYVNAAYQRLVGNYLVQRTWSNSSAAAGHDPCVPVLPGPYVAAAPSFGEVTLDYGNGTATALGIQVTNGSYDIVELDLFSDAPADDWTVGADDVASQLQNLPAELSLSIERNTGNNGDKLYLTIKRLKNGDGGGSELVLTSKVAGQVVALWWGLVTN